MGFIDSELGMGICYGSIGEILTMIAYGQDRHSYAIIPEWTYQDWLKLQDFKRQVGRKKTCDDGIERMIDTAYFDSSGTKWAITTVKCPSNSDDVSKGNRFVVNIKKNNKFFSRSKLSIGAMFRIVRP